MGQAEVDTDLGVRLRERRVGGLHDLAFARPWGFEPEKITVPVGIWRGTQDTNVPAEHADWLLTHIPTAHGHVYAGGHLPDTDVYRQIYDWLHADPR